MRCLMKALCVYVFVLVNIPFLILGASIFLTRMGYELTKNALDDFVAWYRRS